LRRDRHQSRIDRVGGFAVRPRRLQLMTSTAPTVAAAASVAAAAAGLDALSLGIS
jgi:hypothetical protein